MDNNLKKEFAPRDVQRMRNIISNNAGAATQLQSGWEKQTGTYKEGDVWEESGKKWTIKNGIKQTVTKLDEIKKLVTLPLACPECNKLMKITDLNKKMWTIHKTCFDCVIEMETKIKTEGKWEEYSAGIMNANKDAELTDLEKILDEWVVERDTFVSEAGEVETWKGGDKTAVYKHVKERIAELKKLDIYNQTDL
jgi:hypothetical protein